MSYIESGKKQASLNSLVMLANAMEVMVDALLDGNLICGSPERRDEMALVMEDCSEYERRVIFEQMLSLKAALRRNHGFLELKR